MNETASQQEASRKQGGSTGAGDDPRRPEDSRQRAREEVARLRKEAETRKMEMEDEIARLHRAEEMAKIELDEVIEKLRAEEDAIRERTQAELDRLRAREESVLDSLDEDEEREWARRRRVQPADSWRGDPLWDLPETRPARHGASRAVEEGSNLARAYTLASIEQLRLVSDAIRSLTDSVTGGGDPYSGSTTSSRTRGASRRRHVDVGSRRRSSRAPRTVSGDPYGGVLETLERAIEIPARTMDRFYDAYSRG